MIQGIADRIAMIPLILKRVPTKTSKLEKGTVIKGLHFTMQLSLGMSLLELQRMALLPPSRALLPQANEKFEAVDDIYVNDLEPNGKSGEEKAPELEKVIEPEKKEPKEPDGSIEAEKERTEKPVLHLADLSECKRELSLLLVKIQESGRVLTDAESVKLDAMETVADYQNKITYWKRQLESTRKKGLDK